MENRRQLFQQLIHELENNYDSVCGEFKYLGTGNPSGDVLIFGKECSIDKDNTEQYRREIVGNLSFWKNLKEYNADVIPVRDGTFYSALYPYKGQCLKRDKNGNWGTSDTWMNYQKLFNKIYNSPCNNEINFHEKFFITEVNSTPCRKTRNADKESIDFRKEHVLTHPFFQHFPVIVISGVGYFKQGKNFNEIETLFGVKFNEKKYTAEVKPQPFWVHRNDDNSKIVINSYQLSNGVSDRLLDCIACEIRDSGLLKLN